MRLLIVGLILTSCLSKHETEKPTIGGDWIFVNDSKEITIDYGGLRFKSDTLYTIRDCGLTHEGKFTVSGDTIIVMEFGNKVNKEKRIRKLTKDSLILVSGASVEKFYSRKLEFNNNSKINEIKFTAGGCLGKCATFKFYLNNKGQVHFTPISNCKVNQKREFVLDTKKMDRIDMFSFSAEGYFLVIDK